MDDRKHAAKTPGPRVMKSPLTGLFITLIVVLSALVLCAGVFLIWYFFV